MSSPAASSSSSGAPAAASSSSGSAWNERLSKEEKLALLRDLLLAEPSGASASSEDESDTVMADVDTVTAASNNNGDDAMAATLKQNGLTLPSEEEDLVPSNGNCFPSSILLWLALHAKDEEAAQHGIVDVASLRDVIINELRKNPNRKTVSHHSNNCIACACSEDQ